MRLGVLSLINTCCRLQALDGHALQAPFTQRTDPQSVRDAEPWAGAEIERTERIACTVGPAEVNLRVA